MEKVIVFLGDKKIGIASCSSDHVEDVVGALCDGGAACCSDLPKAEIFEADCSIGLVGVGQASALADAIATLDQIASTKVKPMRMDAIKYDYQPVLMDPKPVYKNRYAKRHHLKSSW